MKQIGRNFTDGVDGFLLGYSYLIHDRSTLFTSEFLMILQSAGVKSVRLPVRSPNLDAFAERFVRSIKEECLERNDQGLENEIIEPDYSAQCEGKVQSRERLGGLLRHYYRNAA